MKHLFKFSLLLLAFLLPATALAHDFEVGGIYYKINGNEVSVTYKGAYETQYSNEYSGSVTIPSSVTYSGTTYSVTSIGDNAFFYCTGLTSVTIPNSVTNISYQAFYYCSGLTSITIGNSVTSIGDNAFSGCRGLTSITIPNSVTSIGDYAFRDCSSLISVTIDNSVTTIGFYVLDGCSSLTSIVVANGNPKYDSRGNCNAIIETASNTLILGCKNTVIPNSVTTIGGYAFSGCSGLTSITIPNSVTSISEWAFSGCSGLTSITIPNSVTSISEWAFYDCGGLTSITIPNSVTTIGVSAFFGCSLTSIEIPNSVTTIGDAAFSSCSGLTSITVASSNTHYDSRNNCNAIIETATNTLVAGCKNSIIPNSVTSIGNGAFSWCSGLTSIDIPNSVTSIGGGAFEYCMSLANVNIGNSVTSIGSEAFYNCIDLTRITIPNTVNSIGYGAFNYCNIQDIYCLALTPPTIQEYSFDMFSYGATLYVPDIALEAYKAADYWNAFNNIVGIPYTFEVDGTSYQATTMNTVSVMANGDEGILYTGDVVIPDSVAYAGHTFVVTGIENNAFDGCFELTSITIPNSVEAIGEQAFQGCTGLKSVTIGSGVTAIGAKAFNYCNALETVKCLGTVPPVMASTDCFSTAAYNRATLLVPRQFVEAYNTADYWYKFAHIDGWGSAGRGDIDGDGVVSINDVTRMIDAILTGDYEGIYFESADVNINGRLDIGDVTTIIDMLLNDIR